ncbi:MAG: GntR family transcriptional regulator [Burkholderiaceae bacterium]|nr:GntR family transcriptional regulator [Burkholderiaceae bacterium]
MENNLTVVNLEAKTAGPLVDQAIQELERRFVILELAPGSVWSETSLSELLEIGRTPVREAIARMAVDGLVTVMPRAGIVISNISVENQLAVLETRRVLEALVSARAARKCTDEERAKLRTMAQSIENAGAASDVRGYIHWHFEIKRFVAACARNPYAARALRPLHTLSQRFYFAYHRELDNLPTVGTAHAQLTRAIADGDEIRAASRSNLVSDIAEHFTRDLLLARGRIPSRGHH